MGYKIMCYPKDAPSGDLARGTVQPPYLTGTYYSHPSAATLSAKRWVLKTGGTAEVQTWRDGAVVETICK